jgi:hypothetical protein
MQSTTRCNRLERIPQSEASSNTVLPVNRLAGDCEECQEKARRVSMYVWLRTVNDIDIRMSAVGLALIT